MVVRRLIIAALLVLTACGSAPVVTTPTDVPPTATRITEVDPTDTAAPTVTETPTDTATPEPTATVTPVPIAVTVVRQRGGLRPAPDTGRRVGSYVCPGDQLALVEQIVADGYSWYSVRVIATGPSCQRDRAPEGAEGWLTSRFLEDVPAEQAALVPTPPADRVTSTPTKEPTRTPRPTNIPAAPGPGSGQRIGAICRDGTRSSATGSGACSRHGGVDHWIYR